MVGQASFQQTRNCPTKYYNIPIDRDAPGLSTAMGLVDARHSASRESKLFRLSPGNSRYYHLLVCDFCAEYFESD